MRRLMLLTIAVATALAGSAAGAVTRSVPGTYATIQSAINASSPGDVVAIGPGTYLENLNLKSGVTLQGSGMGVTIVNGKGVNYAIYVTGSATAETRIRDLTATNGMAYQGGGIKLETKNSCEIQRVEVTGNTATSKGGGIYIGLTSKCKILDSFIVGNSAKLGGGIYSLTSFAHIKNTVICDNKASDGGGGYYGGTDCSTLENVTIDGNIAPEGAGVMLGNPISFNLVRSIISNSDGGAGLWSNGPLTSTCNIFWSNAMGNYSGVGVPATDRSVDPMYCDRPSRDFHVNAVSPAAVGSCGLVGALPPACGASTATSEVTWGGLKAKFH